jgi:L-rhamnose mutarotase
MRKVAFKLKLRPGCKAEYKRRHDNIWPELKTLLKESGISDYSIYFDEETDSLFAVQTISGKNSSQDLFADRIIKRWWKSMADIMETNEDFSPVTRPLEEVFHLD